MILPASLPAISLGLRLALGNSLLIIIAAVFVVADQGLVYLDLDLLVDDGHRSNAWRRAGGKRNAGLAVHQRAGLGRTLPDAPASNIMIVRACSHALADDFANKGETQWMH